MKTAAPLALLAVLALAACGDRRAPEPTASDQPPAQSPPARTDVENPATGTNSQRPDSPRDLKPGTDGNTPPVR